MPGRALVLLLAFAASAARASFLDPHSPDFSLTWSEGWYFRVVVDAERSDPGAPASLGLVAGYLPRARKGLNSSLVAILLQGEQESAQLQVLRDLGQNFNVTAHGRPITADPDPDAPPDFAVHADRLSLRFESDTCRLAAFASGVLLEIVCIGVASPYGPHGESPEGFLARWPTRWLGQHWFVQSLSTPVAFALALPQPGSPDLPRIVNGRGFVHVEKNWAEAFPAGWVWAQGMRISNASVKSAFVLAGGPPPSPLVPGIVAGEAWLLGVRAGALSWRFHPWDPTLFSASAQPCGDPHATFRLTASQPLTGREVEVEVAAPARSFAPLEVPTRHGFRQHSQHSYAATARVRMYERTGGAGGRVLVHSAEMPASALEFGGDRRCAAAGGASASPTHRR